MYSEVCLRREAVLWWKVYLTIHLSIPIEYSKEEQTKSITVSR